jgi:hypothetical protein
MGKVIGIREGYKSAMKARQSFRKANDYEVFNWNLCLVCLHFKADAGHPWQGDCCLMGKEGCYPGVMAQAVCNRFLSRAGTDINGKVIIPSLLPAYILTRKEGGEMFAVYETEKEEAARLTKEIAVEGKKTA